MKLGHRAAENRKVTGSETEQARDIWIVTQELGNSAEITAPGLGCCSFYRRRFGFCALILLINDIAKQMCWLRASFLTSTAESGNSVITFVTVDVRCRQQLHPV